MLAILPAGALSSHLSKEVHSGQHRGRSIWIAKCCCQAQFVCILRSDPETTPIKSVIDWKSRVEISYTYGFPWFGHNFPDCPGRGCPFPQLGIYTWDGSMWCS